jgi:hypothetical protein
MMETLTWHASRGQPFRSQVSRRCSSLSLQAAAASRRCLGCRPLIDAGPCHISIEGQSRHHTEATAGFVPAGFGARGVLHVQRRRAAAAADAVGAVAGRGWLDHQAWSRRNGGLLCHAHAACFLCSCGGSVG